MNKFSIVILVGALFIVSCACGHKGGNDPKDEVSLYDVDWMLVELNKEKIEAPADLKTPFIRFSREENKVNGHTGCNGFFGTFELKADSIEFGPIGMTQMACQEWMDEEMAFTALLDKTVRCEIKGDTLLLRNEKGGEGIFKKKLTIDY